MALRGELFDFQAKLNKYLGNGPAYKKQTQEEKWELKEKYGIEFKKNPIKSQWEKVDRILRLKQLAILFDYNKNKNRY